MGDRITIMCLAQCPDHAQSASHQRSAAFPPPELPSFIVALRLKPYSNAATLDTEQPAKSYSGENLNHLSSSHFQNARLLLCYLSV